MKLTFCINTAKNERHHLELLFRSLDKNLSRKDHDFLVYIENDNQDSLGYLRFVAKEMFPSLKIIKNPLPVPIGYARNINLMFEMAQTEVVSYLQSDMVIGKNYDLGITNYLTPDTIISATRIEPPLHPPSPEKITYDFGLDPKTFDLKDFTTYAEAACKDILTDFWFAPFTLYKKNWLDIGGHDTLFRRSREDSDLLYRFTIKGFKIKQTWQAMVYHFTCTSSRGPEWWTEKAKARTMLQQQADFVEMTRFLRKWPAFKHNSTFDPSMEYKYPVSINFENTSINNATAILQNYYRFNKIYVDNEEVRKVIIEEYNKIHNPANQLLDISPEQWQEYKKYYRVWNAEDIFVSEPITNEDVILHVFPQEMNVFAEPIILQINDIIHESEPGQYECGKGFLTINKVNNRIQDNLIVKNPPIDDIKFEIW